MTVQGSAVAEAERLRALRLAHAEVAALVRDLVEPRRVPVTQDGDLVIGEVPSWMAQLRESQQTTGNGGGSGSGGAPCPVNPGAVDVLLLVQRSVHRLHARVMARSSRAVEQHLAAIAEEVACWSSPEQVEAVAKELGLLLGAITLQLDPPRVEVPVREMCPHCDARMVWRRDPSTGERVQADALVLDQHARIVSCRHCASTWPAEFAGQLIAEVNAWRIECDRIRTAAAAGQAGSVATLRHATNDTGVVPGGQDRA